MNILVLADTHIPEKGDKLPEAVLQGCRKVDMIVHAGDFTSFALFQNLHKIGKLKAVSGNMDAHEIKKRLKEKEVFSVEKFKIGLMHGFGRAQNPVENLKIFFDDSFDLVIFGHTHTALLEKKGKTLFFNPGSPTDTVFAPYNSYGLIEIKETIVPKIIRIPT